jgi:flagellar biosynthesis protein FlhF
MQLRTFLAADMREALTLVRVEMGDDAIIVASEKAKGGGVIVRAASEKQVEEAPVERETLKTGTLLGFESTYRDSLVRRLRATPQTGEPVSVLKHQGFNRADLLTQLSRHRLPDALSHKLAQAAEKTGIADMMLALASALDKDMRVAALDFKQDGAILLAGPNGAGKTAVAAKIAAHAREAGRAVLLICADTQAAGAVARLEAFAGHLAVSFAVAETAAALAGIIAQANEKNILAIADLAGFDPRDAKARNAYAALCEIAEPVGVLSALMDAEEAGEMADALGKLGAKRLIVTGLDLARRAGALAACATRDIALAHVARSPYVAAGLDSLTPLSLARLLLGDAP